MELGFNLAFLPDGPIRAAAYARKAASNSLRSRAEIVSGFIIQLSRIAWPFHAHTRAPSRYSAAGTPPRWGRGFSFKCMTAARSGTTTERGTAQHGPAHRAT